MSFVVTIWNSLDMDRVLYWRDAAIGDAFLAIVMTAFPDTT